MRNCLVLIALASVVALAGCQRTAPVYSQPSPLSPAPVGNIENSQLPPAGQAGFPEAPTTTGPSEQQMETVAANAPELTLDSLVGRWTLSTGGNSCDVFMAKTKWGQNWKMAPRGCVDQMKLLDMWNVEGKQVLLSDASGNQIARLYKSGDKRFDGTTASGQPISLNR